MEATAKNKRLEQFSNFVPLLLSFIIAWPTRVFTPVVGLCLVVILMERIMSHRLDTGVVKTKIFLLCSVSALILLTGLLYTLNLKEGFAELERNSILILFPFFIYQCRDAKVTKTQLVFWFLAGVLVLTLYGFLYIFMKMDEAEREWTLKMGHSYYSYLFQLHPTYLAMFLVFGFFFLVEYLRSRRAALKRSSVAAILVVLVYIIFLIWFLRARVSIVGFGMIAVLYALWMIRSIFIKIAVILTCFAAVAITVVAVDVEDVLKKYGRNGLIAMQDRVHIWNSAWEGYKLAPFFGAGTGGAQQLIDEGYLETGFDQGLDNVYNAHNQYLQFLCRNGIPEFIVFVLLCVFCYRKALKDGSVVFLVFLLVSNITMITEAIMSRQKGVAFFYFFVCVFGYLKHE